MAEDDWVTIFTTNDEIDANLKKGLLEQAGIACIIDASVYRPRSIAPVYNQYKINISKERFEEAGEILRKVL